ncbi:hypothetical protein [Streptomyces sp. NPDC056240]|uniref:hypothetical protein n=1 Tax=Streptomyces sp. NPDC056240 TaxID=3345759 RepID=UPI0035DCF656
MSESSAGPPAMDLPSEDECRKAADQYENLLMSLPNVHAVGVGDNWVNVYVECLTSPGITPPDDRVPEALEIVSKDGLRKLVPTKLIVQEPVNPEPLDG